MKKKHRDRILNDKHREGKLIKATKKRVTQEMQNGKDFDSNLKYLRELEQWNRH